MYKLFFIFLVLPFICLSQEKPTGSIIGNVIDFETNQALLNANIFLVNQKIGTTSDKNGKFQLKNVPSGNYIINISFLGYQTYQKKIELKSSQTINLNVALNLSSITSKEVQIIAEKEALQQSTRINLITAKNIELAPVQSITEMIDYSPGVNMSNAFGIFSSKAVVTLRGLPSNDQSRTLVMLDGIPLNKSDEGSVNWNMINKNNIENIKITKGPGPAKYGSGAMGGVIELTSKKPSKKLEGSILLDYGTYNTMSTNITLSGMICDTSNHQFYWGLNGFGRKSDGYITEPEQYQIAADSILTPVFLKEINTSAKLGYNYKHIHNVEVQFSYFDDVRGNGVKVFENYGAFSTHRTNNGIFKYSGTLSNLKWNLNLFDISENYIRMYEYMKEGEYQLYEANSTREDLGGDFNLSSNKFKYHEISAGLNYKQGNVDGSDTYYTSTDIIRNAGKMNTYSVYLQDEMNLLNNKLQINAGIRYDIAKFKNGLFTIDYPSYSIEFYENFETLAMPTKQWDALCPRLSIQYKFSPTNRIYASAAKGFRAPALDDMCRTGKKKGGFKVANPDLNPELITSYELGGDINLTNNLSANISVYYSIGRDFMYYVSTGDTVNMGYTLSPILKKQNIGKVDIYGTELELKYELTDSISVFVNYAYTNAQIKEHQITNSKVDSSLVGKYLTDIPNHKASAGITWKNRILNTSLLFKYVGKSWINDMNTVDELYLKSDKYPDYFTMNIRFDRKLFKNLSANLSIENIFNKTYITSDAQQNPGRFIIGGVKFVF